MTTLDVDVLATKLANYTPSDKWDARVIASLKASCRFWREKLENKAKQKQEPQYAVLKNLA